MLMSESTGVRKHSSAPVTEQSMPMAVGEALAVVGLLGLSGEHDARDARETSDDLQPDKWRERGG